MRTAGQIPTAERSGVKHVDVVEVEDVAYPGGRAVILGTPMKKGRQ
jgi:hypothetical protein